MIDRQLRQMIRLIDDLMDVSRIRQGRIELRREPVELATVVSAAVEMSRPHIDEHGHALAVVLPPDPLVMDADHVRLTQVFMNMLTNAAKYSEKGGRIALHAERHGGRWWSRRGTTASAFRPPDCRPSSSCSLR